MGEDNVLEKMKLVVQIRHGEKIRRNRRSGNAWRTLTPYQGDVMHFKTLSQVDRSANLPKLSTTWIYSRRVSMGVGFL